MLPKHEEGFVSAAYKKLGYGSDHSFWLRSPKVSIFLRVARDRPGEPLRPEWTAPAAICSGPSAVHSSGRWASEAWHFSGT